jgi:uncharacterized protein YkwD
MATTHKVITRALGLASVATLGALTAISPASAAAPAAVAASTTVTPTASGINTQEANVAKWINVVRAQHGLAPLADWSCPNYYAEHLAARLESSSTLAHQSLAHIADACAASYVGENIARGPMSSNQTVDAWMASAPHRANILDPHYTRIGVGIRWTPQFSYTTVADFARP